VPCALTPSANPPNATRPSQGILYIEDAASPAKRAAKAKSEQSYKLQSYYGYAFESYCTVDPPQPSAPAAPQPPRGDGFAPPNTNVQWCSIVKSNIGGVRIILGGEVDCVKPSASRGKVSTSDFIELKTNIAIGSQREEEMFERNKLLKHYVQSCTFLTAAAYFANTREKLTGMWPDAQSY
jgi:RAT1-interacting protein